MTAAAKTRFCAQERKMYPYYIHICIPTVPWKNDEQSRPRPRLDPSDPSEMTSRHWPGIASMTCRMFFTD